MPCGDDRCGANFAIVQSPTPKSLFFTCYYFLPQGLPRLIAELFERKGVGINSQSFAMNEDDEYVFVKSRRVRDTFA